MCGNSLLELSYKEFMEIVYDKEKIANIVEKYRINEYFSNMNFEMKLIHYQPGEYIKSPLDERNDFQFLVEGAFSIYYVRDDGTIYSLAHGEGLYSIGIMELLYKQHDDVYVEAVSKVLCVAISMTEYDEVLLTDVVFLRKIAEHLANTLQSITRMDATASSLEERLLNYFQYLCKDYEFCGVEKTAFQLHCSRRQLQRVLNKLEEEERVVKIAKGRYRLKNFFIT